MNNHKKFVLGTLSIDAFVMVNKKLAKRVGFVEAGLIAELIFTFKTVSKENAFFDGGEQGEWFYLTQAKVQEQIGLKRTEHENAIKSLVKKEIIFKKKMGLPSKNYYLIQWEKITEFLEEDDPEPAPQSVCRKPANKDVGNLQTSMEETDKLDCSKPTSIHINKKELEKESIKTINKKIVNKAGEFITKDELVNIGNDYYSEFASGRWSKKEWTTIINQFTSECLDRKIINPKAYIKASLEEIARRHDLKNGKVEPKFKSSGILPLYNWLEKEEQEDEMPW